MALTELTLSHEFLVYLNTGTKDGKVVAVPISLGQFDKNEVEDDATALTKIWNIIEALEPCLKYPVYEIRHIISKRVMTD